MHLALESVRGGQEELKREMFTRAVVAKLPQNPQVRRRMKQPVFPLLVPQGDDPVKDITHP